MISRSLYLNIIIRVLLIVILSLLLGYLIFMGHNLRLIIIDGTLIIITTVSLGAYLNSTNRKIKYFFEAVRNEDSSLSFPADIKNPVVNEIHKGMNGINSQIQQLRIEITKQEQFFRTLIEHLATGIITYNEKGFIIHANTAAKSLLRVDVLTHIQQIGRVDNKLYNAISGIRPAERRLIAFNTGQGEIQLSLKATSLRTDGSELIILSIQDIKNELDEKELESWMRLIRVLMHEIMNSITPITSLSESLSHIFSVEGKPVSPGLITPKTVETTLNGLNVIREQGKGLKSFVDSYRRLTRLPEPVKTSFRVAELLGRVQLLYESLENSGRVKLVNSFQDPEFEIFADQNLISQVLINLVKNALEANEDNPGGKITISARQGERNNTEICVADNGPGITPDIIDEIFVPFFTTRKNGSGIGLSVSRQIMKAHGGNLTVSSVPGKETVFCLTF